MVKGAEETVVEKRFCNASKQRSCSASKQRLQTVLLYTTLICSRV